MNQGPMTAHWLAKALGDSERYDALLKLLTDKSQPGWANILSQGATYTWELWDAPAPGESESHAWGAHGGGGHSRGDVGGARARARGNLGGGSAHPEPV